VPAAAETVALHAIFELVRLTGTRVHLCRLSSAAGVALVRAAKAEGLPVTADVSINSLHLTDVDIGYFNASMRLSPPLRQQADRDALRAALADGTIDALVSDHTPVGSDAKTLPFAEAEPGATGLELLLPLVLKWGEAQKLPLAATLARITTEPARILGVEAGRITLGAPADLAIFDPRAAFQVSPQSLKSQGKNTPFLGYELAGRVRYTLLGGSVVYET
jgi:dihydroorotase